MEKWMDINGFVGHYKISNTGVLKSVKFGKEKLIKYIEVNTGGYKVARLSLNGKEYRKYIHRLVAECFVELDANRNYVNHKDGDKLNNHASNLEWVTKRENCCHSSLLKRIKSDYVGVRKSNNRFIAAIVYNGENITLGSFKNQEDASEARVKFEKENGIINKYSGINRNDVHLL